MAGNSTTDAELGASTNDSHAETSGAKVDTPSVITRLNDKYNTSENMGPAISEGLSNLLKRLIRDRANGKKDDERKRVLEHNLRPENCEVLAPPTVNKEIWGNISSTSRSSDLEYQKMQKVLLRAMAPIMTVVDQLLKKDPNGTDKTTAFMIESLMEATSMMAFANDDINTIRKNSIKSELNHDYRSLCSSQTPVTEYLFGDNISEQVKAIQDTNKVSKKVSSSGQSESFLGSRPSWTSGSRRGRGGRGKSRYNPYSPRKQYGNGQGNNKSQWFNRNNRRQ